MLRVLKYCKCIPNPGGNHLTVFSKSQCPCLFVACCDISAELLKSLINQPWLKFKEVIENDTKIWPNQKMYFRTLVDSILRDFAPTFSFFSVIQLKRLMI